MAARSEAVGGARARVIDEAALLKLTLIGLLAWQIGLYYDVWNHLQFGFQIESFINWSHAALYGGWFISGVPTAIYLLDGIRTRGDLSLPPGYLLVLLGVGGYGVGGGFDMWWHSTVGFEARHDAVLAPSHLLLAIALTTFCFGVFRAAVWHANREPSRMAHLQVGFALGALLWMSHWYVGYASPLATDFATGGAAVRATEGFSGVAWTNMTAEISGTTGIFLYTLLAVLFIVLAMRHLRVGTGAVAVLLLDMAIIVVPATNQWLFLPCAVIAAVLAEALWRRIRKGGFGGPDQWLGYAVIGALVPTVQIAVYLATVGIFGGGVIWTPHLWAGVPLAAGICGLTAALLLAPPRFVRPLPL